MKTAISGLQDGNFVNNVYANMLALTLLTTLVRFRGFERVPNTVLGWLIITDMRLERQGGIGICNNAD